MKKRTNKDILDIISRFQKQLDRRPSLKIMFEEVQMMKFKVRPIQGDLSAVNLKNEKFISSLWSLGKLDEFYQKEFFQLTRKNQELFKRIFDSIYLRYQNELNRVNLRFEKTFSNDGLLEVEIFKDKINNRN